MESEWQEKFIISNIKDPEKKEIEIKKYLKQDIIVTKYLYEYFDKTFSPLKKYLSEKDKYKFLHINSSTASLVNAVISNMIGIDIEWNKERPNKLENF